MEKTIFEINYYCFDNRMTTRKYQITIIIHHSKFDTYIEQQQRSPNKKIFLLDFMKYIN